MRRERGEEAVEGRRKHLEWTMARKEIKFGYEWQRLGLMPADLDAGIVVPRPYGQLRSNDRTTLPSTTTLRRRSKGDTTEETSMTENKKRKKKEEKEKRKLIDRVER